MSSYDKNSPGFHRPADFGLQAYWDEQAPCGFVSLSKVQDLLDQLYDQETWARRNAAALRVQRVFRGWACRKALAWNPNTAVGEGLLLMRFRRFE